MYSRGGRFHPAPSRSFLLSREAMTHLDEIRQLRPNAVSPRFAVISPRSTNIYLQAPTIFILIGVRMPPLCPDQDPGADWHLGSSPWSIRLIPAGYWIYSKSIMCINKLQSSHSDPLSQFAFLGLCSTPSVVGPILLPMVQNLGKSFYCSTTYCVYIICGYIVVK